MRNPAMSTIVLLTCLILFCKSYSQDLRLANIFGSGMVLQQRDTIKVWGKNSVGSIVRLQVDWNDVIYEGRTDSAGKWAISLPTPPASFNPYEMKILSGTDQIHLKDILIGDVWFVSGQSNMYESLRGFINQPVNRAQEILLESNAPGMRLFKVKEGSALVKSDSIEGSWQYCRMEHVIDFSAVGYVFGKTVYDYVQIPIGLVQCAQSGSLAEAWLDMKSLEDFGRIDLSNIEILEGLGTSRPTLQYNRMLHPLLGLRIKGVIWYQGEANVHAPEVYKSLFPYLITTWRDYFDEPDLPFYYVQIAPYSYDYAPGLQSQYLREVQLQTMHKLPNVGMAVSLDVGDQDKIHPSEKEILGKRLAYWALNHSYGVKEIACRGPELKRMYVKDGKAFLKFNYAPGGLTTYRKALSGFEIAGEDRVFYPAQAAIGIEDGTWESMLSVWAEQVPEPVAVRYGFQNYIEGCLYNTQGLPASSFRTDDW